MNKVKSQRGWRVFLGSFILLLTSYVVYFARYPIWGWTVEPIFAVLILSYAIVLVTSLALLKKDLKKPLSDVFGFHGSRLVLLGLGLGVLFQVVWYSITLGLGTKMELSSFPTLSGYESYTYYSLATAFILYAVFAVFGAFAEEVAYKGYVLTRISAKYGIVVGTFVSATFFSLQHIHIFQLPWIESFFQGQFVNVMLGGLVGGYFFYKTKGDIWSIFAFHTANSILNISLPIQLTYTLPYAYYISTIASYSILFVLLWFLPLSKARSSSSL